MIGKTLWSVSDGFMNDTKNGEFESHEAICVLNISGRDASLSINVYFEDREPICGFKATCKNDRANHIRLDKITDENGNHIPKNVPYALTIESNVPVVVQHSRMDVSQPEMTLMTTIAY